MAPVQCVKLDEAYAYATLNDTSSDLKVMIQSVL